MERYRRTRHVPSTTWCNCLEWARPSFIAPTRVRRQISSIGRSPPRFANLGWQHRFAVRFQLNHDSSLYHVGKVVGTVGASTLDTSAASLYSLDPQELFGRRRSCTNSTIRGRKVRPGPPKKMLQISWLPLRSDVTASHCGHIAIRRTVENLQTMWPCCQNAFGSDVCWLGSHGQEDLEVRV